MPGVAATRPGAPGSPPVHTRFRRARAGSRPPPAWRRRRGPL